MRVCSCANTLGAPTLNAVPEHRAYPERIPLYWLNRSTDLRGAAAAVWYVVERKSEWDPAQTLGLGEGFDIRLAAFPSYLMLCGMSLESLIKGVFVSRGDAAPQGHELHRLAQRAHLNLTAEEFGLLELLSHYVAWYARYPAPRKNTLEMSDKLEALTQRHFFDAEELPGGMIIFQPKQPGPLDWDSFSLLWGRVGSGFRMPGS